MQAVFIKEKAEKEKKLKTLQQLVPVSKPTY
jgi:hypothetical protein